MDSFDTKVHPEEGFHGGWDCQPLGDEGDEFCTPFYGCGDLYMEVDGECVPVTQAVESNEDIRYPAHPPKSGRMDWREPTCPHVSTSPTSPPDVPARLYITLSTEEPATMGRAAVASALFPEEPADWGTVTITGFCTARHCWQIDTNGQAWEQDLITAEDFYEDDEPDIDDDFPMSVEYDGLWGGSDFQNELTAQQEAAYEAEWFGGE